MTHRPSRRLLGTYFAMMGLAAVISLGRQVSLASLLVPEVFGVLSLGILSSTYFSYLWTLGTHEGLLKESTGRLDNQNIGISTHSVWVFTAASFTVAAVFWSGIAGLSLRGTEYAILAFAVPLISYARSLSALSLIEFRARREHTRFATVLAFRNSLSLAGASTGAYVAPSVIAPAIGDAIAYGVVSLRALHKSGALGLHSLKGRFREGRCLVRVGLPYALISFLRNLGINLDKWGVAFFLSTQELGLYSLTMLFLALGSVLMNVIGLRLQPELLARVAAGEPLRGLFRDVKLLSGKLLLASLVSVGPCAFLAIELVDRFLPLYSDITVALVVLTLIGVSVEIANVFDAASMPFGVAYRGVRVYAATTVFVLVGVIVCGIVGAPLWAYALVFVLGRLANLVGNFAIIQASI